MANLLDFAFELKYSLRQFHFQQKNIASTVSGEFVFRQEIKATSSHPFVPF